MARVKARSGRWRIAARTVRDLAHLMPAATGELTRLDVKVEDWIRPAGWLGQATDERIASAELKVVRSGAKARLEYVEPVPAADALQAAVALLQPTNELNCLVNPAADVDPMVHRPLGRAANLEPSVIAAPVRLQDLSAADVMSLRKVTAVTAEDLTSRLRHQYQAAGLLVLGAGDIAPSDPLEIQVASVRARRHALRSASPAALANAWPEVSGILLAHRGDFLARSIAQWRRMDYPRFELVIALHGDAVDQQWVHSLLVDFPHRVKIVRIEGDVIFGSAMQQACMHGDGDLFTKIDDDDYYGPQHVWDLVLARMYSGAQITGKALDWVHVESEDVTVFRPTYRSEKYADFVAGGTFLMSYEDLDRAGGWAPVPKHIDRALLDAVLAQGGLVYRTTGLGYVYVRRGEGHTAQVADEHFMTKNAARYPGLLRHAEFGTEESGDSHE